MVKWKANPKRKNSARDAVEHHASASAACAVISPRTISVRNLRYLRAITGEFRAITGELRAIPEI
jgi:hypothetical protein